MREVLRSLAVMVKASWRADRVRSLGALLTTGLLPVTRPLRAIGLGMMADGVIGRDHDHAVAGALLVAGLTGLSRMLEWASLTVRMRLREHTILYLDERVMELAGGIPGMEHHERPEHRDSLEMLRVDRHWLVNPFMPIAWTLASVVQLVATVAVLARLHPVLALLPLAGVPSLVAGVWSERAREGVRRVLAEDTRKLLHLMEVATQPASAKEVRVFGLAGELIERHRTGFREMEGRVVRFNVVSGLALAAGWTVFALGYMGAVAFVSFRVVGGALTIGSVVLTLSMGAQINSQLSELVSNATWFSRTANAIGRYRWLLGYAEDAHAAVAPADPQPVPSVLRRGIVLDGVTFGYPGMGETILRDVHLTLPAGSTVAIVGENGAGKTTLVKLLCRFYEPTSGVITVDGTNLSSFPVDEWRQHVSAGFQDFAKLQLVARQSVGVGSLPSIDDEPVVERALVRAAAPGLSAGLPDGLDTQLGREFGGGVELSLGQWQKVALGRAMMRFEPLVLVLDEPTASLDAATEHALFERFAGTAREAAAARGAITVLVSHRFSTVRMADLIVVISDGGIAESGSHAELMAEGGLYAELFALQARSYT